MILKCNKKGCGNYNINISYSTIKIIVRGGEIEYCNKNGVQHTCDKCKKPLIEVKNEVHQGFGAYHCAFSGKTSDEKIAILKKRERDHYKKDKSAHEFKKYKDDGGI